MDILIKIVLLIALVSFIYLVYSLVILINDMRKTLDKTSNSIDGINNEVKTLVPKVSLLIDDIRDLKTKVNESLFYFDQLQIKANGSLDELSDLSNQVSNSLENIENRTEKFIEVLDPIEKLFKVLYNKVFPVLSFSGSFVNAFSKGIKVFSNRVSK